MCFKPIESRGPRTAGCATFKALQGAYLLLAARALGLAAGPMSGFDTEKVNREFFADTSYHANFLANLGYPDGSGSRSRGPRLEFSQVAEVI